MTFGKLLKNALSLALTIWLMSAIVDYWRRPEMPPEMAQMTLTDLNGYSHNLAKISQDRPIIVYFWGSWCGYCRYTSPAINQLAQEGETVMAIALRSGSAEKVQHYLNAQQLSFTTINDPNGDLAARWQVRVTPTIILLHRGKMDIATTGWTSLWGLKARIWLSKIFA